MSTSNAAASASAFSFRASSRSSVRIRFMVASEARPSSPQGHSPLLVFGLQNAFPLEEIRQLATRERARSRQDPNLLLDRPVAPRALRRHGGKTTRLLPPPRERLLAEAGFQCQLPRTDRIFAGQARHHLLSKCQRERLRHRVVAFSPR